MPVYDYYPSTTLRLGGGVDPNNPLTVLPTCAQFLEKPIEGTAVTTTFALSLVNSRKELYSALSVSASLSAQYAFFSASGALSFDNDYAFSSDSVVWMLKAYSDFGRFEAANPTLTVEAKAVLNADPKEFARRYGTEIVLQERRAAQIAAVFSLQNISEQQKQKLETSFQGGVSLGLFSGDMQAAYKSFAAEATRISAMSIAVFAIGGGGIGQLANIITDGTDLNAVAITLREYASTLTLANSVPTQYMTGSMGIFGWNGQEADVSYRDQVLADLYLVYKDISNTKDRLQALVLTDPESPLGKLLSPEMKTKYLALYKDYQNRLKAISDGARACRAKDSDCPNPADQIPLELIQWPQLPSSPRVIIDRVTTNLLKAQDGSIYYSVDVFGQLVYQWDDGDEGYWLVNNVRSTDITPITGPPGGLNFEKGQNTLVGVIGTFSRREANRNTKSAPIDYTGIRVPVVTAGPTSGHASLAIEFLDRFGRRFTTTIFAV